jgi:hypothetical protein
VYLVMEGRTPRVSPEIHKGDLQSDRYKPVSHPDDGDHVRL